MRQTYKGLGLYKKLWSSENYDFIKNYRVMKANNLVEIF